VVAAQSELVMQIFLFNMYNYFDRVGSAFLNKPPLGTILFHLNFIAFSLLSDFVSVLETSKVEKEI
jgi:hypothetical protein